MRSWVFKVHIDHWKVHLSNWTDSEKQIWQSIWQILVSHWFRPFPLNTEWVGQVSLWYTISKSNWTSDFRIWKSSSLGSVLSMCFRLVVFSANLFTWFKPWPHVIKNCHCPSTWIFNLPSTSMHLWWSCWTKWKARVGLWHANG